MCVSILDCPNGHDTFEKSCYFPSFKDDNWIGAGTMKWEDARDECRKLSNQYPSFKYDLISLQSEKEYDFLLHNDWCYTCGKDTPTPYNSWKEKGSFWTGLNDIDVEGEYEWSDGSVLEYGKTFKTKPWMETEPNNSGVCN